jgi:hypothetical protein
MRNWASNPGIGLRLLGALAVIANAGAIYQYGSQEPWLFVACPFVVAGAVLLPLHRRLFAFVRIRRLLTTCEACMRTEGIRSSLLIAFDRSSAIFAGMLAQRLGVSEIVALPRSASLDDTGRRRVVVGRGITVGLEGPEARDLSTAVVVVFYLRTGATLDAGLAAIGGHGFPGRIVALYATEGALAQWPRVAYLHKVSPGDPPDENFPWINGPYVHR